MTDFHFSSEDIGKHRDLSHEFRIDAAKFRGMQQDPAYQATLWHHCLADAIKQTLQLADLHDRLGDRAQLVIDGESDAKTAKEALDITRRQIPALLENITQIEAEIKAMVAEAKGKGGKD